MMQNTYKLRETTPQYLHTDKTEMMNKLEPVKSPLKLFT